MNTPPSDGPVPKRSFPQVKICGLTRPGEAVGCAQAGADAIGLVFFPKSPRHVTRTQARAVVKALPQRVAAVGVFVNASFDDIMRRVDYCGLSVAQLHGQEPPELAVRLRTEGVGVIKALFVDGTPGLVHADDYTVDAFLVEGAKGPLPGGNAMAWDWAVTREFGQRYPLVLAGGLSPDNVQAAIRAGRPRAVDLSSGVEAAPGRKDPGKVNCLLAAVRKTGRAYIESALRPVFHVRGDRFRD